MEPPVGIAFITGQLGLGGAEQQLYYLLSGLDRSRFRPLVITLGVHAEEYWSKPIARLGIPVRHVNRWLGRLVRAFRIATILRQEKIHIVHGWVFHTNPYSAVAGRLAKVSLRLGSMRENYRGLPKRRVLRRMGYWGLDALITNSVHNACHVKKLDLTTARVQIVPNGVFIPALVSQTDRSHLKKELGFSDTDILIGSVGRLDSNKNYSMLLRAFAPLTQHWSGLRLLIIGDGPLKKELSEMAEDLDIASKVCLPGQMPQAARFLPAMAICCLTSYTEGMPNLIMEAAAAGLPVVSTRCGDSAYLVEDGVTGYLVSPNDDAGMSAHLGVLLANAEHRLRMGSMGREKMRREFGVNAMVSRMTQVYEQLLTERKLAPATFRTAS